MITFIKKYKKIIILFIALAVTSLLLLVFYFVYSEGIKPTSKISKEFKVTLPKNLSLEFDEIRNYAIISNDKVYYSEIKVLNDNFDKAKELVNAYHVPGSKLESENTDSANVNNNKKYVRKLKNNHESRKTITYLNIYAYEMVDSDKSFIFIIESTDEGYIQSLNSEIDNIYNSIKKI